MIFWKLQKKWLNLKRKLVSKKNNSKKKVFSKKKLNSQQLTIEILKFLEQKRNVLRADARKEHGDTNSDKQGIVPCAFFDKRGGCKHGRQCNMHHPPIATELTESLMQIFITVINGTPQEQAEFVESCKKRPINF